MIGISHLEETGGQDDSWDGLARRLRALPADSPRSVLDGRDWCLGLLSGARDHFEKQGDDSGPLRGWDRSGISCATSVHGLLIYLDADIPAVGNLVRYDLPGTLQAPSSYHKLGNSGDMIRSSVVRPVCKVLEHASRFAARDTSIISGWTGASSAAAKRTHQRLLSAAAAGSIGLDCGGEPRKCGCEGHRDLALLRQPILCDSGGCTKSSCTGIHTVWRDWIPEGHVVFAGGRIHLRDSLQWSSTDRYIDHVRDEIGRSIVLMQLEGWLKHTQIGESDIHEASRALLWAVDNRPGAIQTQ